jgi:hypothetical protein
MRLLPILLLIAVAVAPVRAETPEAAAFERAMLDAHNDARGQVGVAPLAWNAQLAEEAGQWARHLAREGRMMHAGAQNRDGAGENLWMGSSGHYHPREMVGLFVEERHHYRHGAFPEVSATGDWRDVGHYTQVVWRDTREIGCAVARGQREDFLVCRYWPAGNYRGQSPY